MVRRWVWGVVKEFFFAELGAVIFGLFGFFGGAALFIGGVFNSALGVFVWGASRAIGASVGISFFGGKSGIQGNTVMAYSLPAILLSILPITTLLLESEFPGAALEDVIWIFGYASYNRFTPLSILYVAFIPALLAVVGYNLKVKTKGKA